MLEVPIRMNYAEGIFPIIIALAALYLSIDNRIKDKFYERKSKYNDENDKLYLSLLTVYASASFNETAKQFVKNLIPNGINTTYYNRYHAVIFLSMQQDKFFEKDFRDFAEEVERRYWKEFRVKFLYDPTHLSAYDSVMDRFTAKFYELLVKNIVIFNIILFLGVFIQAVAFITKYNSTLSEEITSILGWLGFILTTIAFLIHFITVFTQNKYSKIFEKHIKHYHTVSIIRRQNEKAKNLENPDSHYYRN